MYSSFFENRILLVVPNYYENTDGAWRRYEMPLGLAYINSALRTAGLNVTCINLNHILKDPYEALAERIKKEKIKYVLCGSITPFWKTLKRIFECAKEVDPNIITIGGGGAFTSEPIIFTEFLGGAVDYSVIGEGDETDVELIKTLIAGKDVSEVKGIVYRDPQKGNYIKTMDRMPVMDLDKLPFPSYEEFDVEEYLDSQRVSQTYYNAFLDKPRFMPITMARSCPYQCKFCFHPVGNKYRTRSLDNFFEEVDWLIEKYQINGLMIMDELFSASLKKVMDFCHRIEPYNLKWVVQMRVDIMTEELLQLMKDTGCVSISYGIESFSETVLENMNKHIKTKDIENALRLTKKVGIDIQGNFIFGDEKETLETVHKTLSWWGKNLDYGLNLGLIETYPGTGYYKDYFKDKTVQDRKDFIKNDNYLINLTNIPEDYFNKIKLAIRMIWLYQNKSLFGIILRITEDQDGQTIYETKCPNCGAINRYVGMDENTLKKLVFRISCRNCGRRNVYYTRPTRDVNGYDTMEYLCRMIYKSETVEDFKQALNTLENTYNLWKNEKRVFPN